MTQQPKDPLHGITLEQLLTTLVERYGWPTLADLIRINCFSHEPSIKSSLKFLRRTPWARKEVETLFIDGEEGLIAYKRSNNASQRTTEKKNQQAETQTKPYDNPWLKGRDG